MRPGRTASRPGPSSGCIPPRGSAGGWSPPGNSAPNRHAQRGTDEPGVLLIPRVTDRGTRAISGMHERVVGCGQQQPGREAVSSWPYRFVC